MWVVYLKERVYSLPINHTYFYDLGNAQDYADHLHDTGRAYWDQICLEKVQTVD